MTRASCTHEDYAFFALIALLQALASTCTQAICLPDSSHGEYLLCLPLRPGPPHLIQSRQHLFGTQAVEQPLRARSPPLQFDVPLLTQRPHAIGAWRVCWHTVA